MAAMNILALVKSFVFLGSLGGLNEQKGCHVTSRGRSFPLPEMLSPAMAVECVYIMRWIDFSAV